MNITDAEVSMDATERDLDLAVELINTRYVRADLPDRLTAVALYQDVLRKLGARDLACQLSPGDLNALRVLRADLAPVFAAATVEDAVRLLDPMLRDAVIPTRLTAIGGAASWTWGTDQRGIDALRARLLAALAAHLVRHGVSRLGVCQANPCPGVFVDRGRARTRRYCCDRCNDRAAALAYRQRNAR
jgi:predicted RNA-binding Zn ribbon-like protein